MFRKYYRLTKPGIIYGNAITAIAGFFFASKGYFDIRIFLGMLIGSSLVMASACVFNNYIDRNIDVKMQRTKKRALVTGTISIKNALAFGTLLGIIGFITLFACTNILTVIIGLVGFIDYVFIYTFSKRTTLHATIIGSVSGATPIVAGYTSATNRFDVGALLLFAILVIWQMPHFYAIAIYRLHDYELAGIPVLPIKKGMLHTKIQMLLYIIAFSIALFLLHVTGFASKTFTIFAIIFCVGWIVLAIYGFITKNTSLWAREMFFSSLIIILLFSILISVEHFIH